MKTVKDFYEFFAAIPRDQWCKLSYISEGACCAAGHLGQRSAATIPPSVSDLSRLIPVSLIAINDDIPGHPKDNILDALQFLAEEGL